MLNLRAVVFDDFPFRYYVPGCVVGLLGVLGLGIPSTFPVPDLLVTLRFRWSCPLSVLGRVYMFFFWVLWMGDV